MSEDKIILECYETINVKKLKTILSHQDYFKGLMRPSSFEGEYAFSFEQLKKYANSVKIGKVKVQYKQKLGRGRMFARGGLSLQSFPREIRGTIANDYYYDIDMSNAHPTLLSHICDIELKYNAKYLNDYIKNRDKIINDILAINPNETNESVKNSILAILNGGTNVYKTFSHTKWMKNFKKEIGIIHDMFIEHYPKTYRKVKEIKEFNIKGSVMNHILCGWENAILECMIEYLKDNHIINNNFVCCFDGIMVPKANIDDIQKLMKDLEAHIYDEYNISIILKQKELKGFDMSDIPETSLTVEATDDKETILLKSAFSDGDIASYFCLKYDNEFKLFNEKLYHFNGNFWEQVNNSTVFNKLDNMYFELLSKLNTDFGDKKHIEFYNNVLTKKLIKLRTSKSLKNIWESIKFRIEIQDDIWDNNSYLLGFINGTYDLKLSKFREANKLDFISKVIPYDFKNVESEEINFAYQFIDKVIPIESERDFFLKTLSTCLDGKLLENIIFALGNGRNGKDTIMTVIMKAVLGSDLYYDAPNYIITDKIKTGANPEVANMHKKRLIVYSEPDKHATLRCATIKQLTGNEIMPVRSLYSSVNETKMCGTHIILQNKLLTMDSPDDAMLNRLFVIPFRAMFRTEEKLAELPQDTKYAHKVDSYYKSTEFIERIKLPIMHILLKYYKIFQKEGNILKNPPKSILDASKQYISDSDDFVNWFNEYYEKSDDENKFIKLKDIYDKFKNSDLWANMNKAERRKMTRAKLEKDIIENPTLRAFFRDRKKINGIDYKSIMIKYKVKSYQNDSDDEEGE